jgi:hypothetical protein
MHFYTGMLQWRTGLSFSMSFYNEGQKRGMNFLDFWDYEFQNIPSFSNINTVNSHEHNNYGDTGTQLWR